MSAANISAFDADNARKAGAIDRLPPSHIVQFYRDDRALVSTVGQYIANALNSGDSAVVITTEARSEALADELYANGLDLPGAVKQGRYQSFDARETLSHFMVDGMPDGPRFMRMMSAVLYRARSAARRERPWVAIFGEMVALLWADGKHAAAIRLEELWNDLAKVQSFTLRCAYPMKGFSEKEHGEPFLKICAAHSHVIPEESYMALHEDEDHLRSIASLQQKLETLEAQKKLLETQQQFRLLVDAVQDYAIFMLDAEGRIQTWNAGAQRIKGYNSSEIIGKHFSCFYSEDDVKDGKPQRELELAIRDGRTEDESWRIRKDGSKFWANVTITALKHGNGELFGFAKVTRDFTERMLAQRVLEESQRKLRDSETSLRQLSLHLLRTQDEERRRIGRDLHDSLGQYLSVLKMKLDSLVGRMDRKSSTEAEDLKNCAKLTEDAVTEVRTISYLLYPPMLEEMGLKSAIPWYVDGFATRSGVKTSFEASPNFQRLPRDIELALFRVLQESLTNVHRHSGSPTATVRLTLQNDEVVLEISDCGKGVDIRKFEESGQDYIGALGVGLRGMSERMRQLGGNLEFSSTPRGTTVVARVQMPEVAQYATTS
jgi:PAS domain S-box-containing protein